MRTRTDRAKAITKMANAEAKKLGHQYVGTEHILFALLISGGIAERILNDLGVDYLAAKEKFASYYRRTDG